MEPGTPPFPLGGNGAARRRRRASLPRPNPTANPVGGRRKKETGHPVACRPRLSRLPLTRTLAAVAATAALGGLTVAAAPASADSLSAVRSDIAAAQRELSAL